MSVVMRQCRGGTTSVSCSGLLWIGTHTKMRKELQSARASSDSYSLPTTLLTSHPSLSQSTCKKQELLFCENRPERSGSKRN